jgi:hypothetical protein
MDGQNREFDPVPHVVRHSGTVAFSFAANKKPAERRAELRGIMARQLSLAITTVHRDRQLEFQAGIPSCAPESDLDDRQPRLG